jgi:hypothetical protein
VVHAVRGAPERAPEGVSKCRIKLGGISMSRKSDWTLWVLSSNPARVQGGRFDDFNGWHKPEGAFLDQE